MLATLVPLLLLSPIATPSTAGPSAPSPSPSSSPATGPVFPFPRLEQRLDNGLRTVVVPTDKSGFFALYELVGTGSRDEVEPGRSGFAHFFEHIMFKGTKAVPADARVALLASLGVDESGFTTDDFTGYSLVGPAEALPRILELEADRYQNLTYGEDVFRVESRAVLGEYNKNFSNPDNKAEEALFDLAFDKHTYKHTTMGFLADIEQMPDGYRYARSFFERFYTPDNVLLVVVGDVDPDAVHAATARAFAGWKGRRAKTDLPDEPPLSAERRRTIGWANPTQDRLHVGWRVPSAVDDPKQAALGLLLQGYAFGPSSALARQVVLDDQLAESVDAAWSMHKDASLFPVASTIKEGKRPDDVLDRVQRALDAIGEGTIDARRFDDVRSNLRYGLLMQLTSAESIASTLVFVSGPSLDTGAVDAVHAALAALTPADMQAYVRAHFGRAQRAVVVLHHESTPSKKEGAR
ncbi:MAG: insulinase family protein [Deltaproteobacteria bacterium]|nr:insulinase family protein [Deltaproteobacteria bacterium]